MKLIDAITQLQEKYGTLAGQGVDPKEIAKILRSAGAKDDVPQHVLDKVMRAGRTLKAMGLK